MGGLRRVGAKPTLRRQPRLSWNLHTGLASQHLHCQHNLNQNTTNPPTPPLQLKNKSATNSLQPNPHFATVSSRLPFKTTFYELISLLIQILLSPLQCQVKGEILKDLVGYPEAIWTGALVPRPLAQSFTLSLLLLLFFVIFVFVVESFKDFVGYPVAIWTDALVGLRCPALSRDIPRGALMTPQI